MSRHRKSVGAAKLSSPSIASSLMLTVVSEPATGMLLEGATGVEPLLPPPPPPPQAATINAIKLADASLELFKRINGTLLSDSLTETYYPPFT